ncbi:hypothetical protein TKK_0015898 [Trichogramma kaykai]
MQLDSFSFMSHICQLWMLKSKRSVQDEMFTRKEEKKKASQPQSCILAFALPLCAEQTQQAFVVFENKCKKKIEERTCVLKYDSQVGVKGRKKKKSIYRKTKAIGRLHNRREYEKLS